LKTPHLLAQSMTLARTTGKNDVNNHDVSFQVRISNSNPKLVGQFEHPTWSENGQVYFPATQLAHINQNDQHHDTGQGDPRQILPSNHPHGKNKTGRRLRPAAGL
jgi:hypothetical protein